MLINQKIKDLRIQHEFTQVQVADFIEVSRSTYTNFEIETEPNISTLIKFSDLYNLTMDELVERNSNKDNNRNKPDKELSPEIKKAIERIIAQTPFRSEIRVFSKSGRILRNSKYKQLDGYILLMRYLLYNIKSDNVLEVTIDLLLTVIQFVCKHSYLQLQCKGKSINHDILNLSGELMKCCSKLAEEIEKEYQRKPQFQKRLITLEDMFNQEFIKDYFNIDLNEILKD